MGSDGFRGALSIPMGSEYSKRFRIFPMASECVLSVPMGSDGFCWVPGGFNSISADSATSPRDSAGFRGGSEGFHGILEASGGFQELP